MLWNRQKKGKEQAYANQDIYYTDHGRRKTARRDECFFAK